MHERERARYSSKERQSPFPAISSLPAYLLALITRPRLTVGWMWAAGCGFEEEEGVLNKRITVG